MYFDLTEEQKMLQANLRALLQDKIDLNALTQASADIVTSLRDTLDSNIAAMGVCGVLVPAAHGGLNLGLLTLVAVSEELGRHAAPSSCVAGALAAWLIAEAGKNTQRSRWLAAVMEGQTRAAFAAVGDGLALTGSNLSGEGEVEAGEGADLFVVPMNDGGVALVERSDAVGLTTRRPLDVSRPVNKVSFKAAKAERLDVSAALAERLRQAQIILLAADAYGAGQRAHDMAVAYALERRQFDRPIAAFQAIKHQLADAALVMAPSRFLPWRAAHAWDTAPSEAGRLAALAKAHTPEVAVTTARAMVEAHGGIGYTWEYPLHLFLKRAMYDRVALGGPALHRAAAARWAEW